MTPLTPAERAALNEFLARGVEALELGNADIDIGTWTGTPDTADGHAAPLPVYPDKLAAVACYALVFVVLPALPFAVAAIRGWLV